MEKFATDEHRSIVPAPQMKRKGFLPWITSDEELLIALVGLFGLTILATTKPSTNDATIEIDLTRSIPLHKKLLSAFEEARKRSDATHSETTLGATKRKLEEAHAAAHSSTATWELGFLGGLGVIQDTPLTRPILTCAALVVDSRSGNILGLDFVGTDHSPTRSTARALVAAFRNTFERPTSVKIHDSVLAADVTKQLSFLIPISPTTDTPEFFNAANALLEKMEKEGLDMH